MARFSAEYKRARLISLWETTGGGATSFYDGIIAGIKGHIATTEGGFLVQSTSHAGHSTSFFVPTAAGLTPVSLAELFAEFYDRYNAAKAENSNTADEAVIYATMLDRLRPIRKAYSDFSRLRA